MDFQRVISGLCAEFDISSIRYALIGGFAMAMRGVQRATVDLDFLLLLEDLERAHEILRSNGYRRVFRSENVSHYRESDSDFGRIDILHAFRGPSLGMLERAEWLHVQDEQRLPVARIEDLIGLKIQAAVNDSTRATQDWADIDMLLQVATQQGTALDWELIGEYLNLFDLGERLQELKSRHDETD